MVFHDKAPFSVFSLREFGLFSASGERINPGADRVHPALAYSFLGGRLKDL
jgi:hypothetical protein